jgi:hypothetical protein
MVVPSADCILFKNLPFLPGISVARHMEISVFVRQYTNGISFLMRCLYAA